MGYKYTIEWFWDVMRTYAGLDMLYMYIGNALSPFSETLFLYAEWLKRGKADQQTMLILVLMLLLWSAPVHMYRNFTKLFHINVCIVSNNNNNTKVLLLREQFFIKDVNFSAPTCIPLPAKMYALWMYKSVQYSSVQYQVLPINHPHLSFVFES